MAPLIRRTTLIKSNNEIESSKKFSGNSLDPPKLSDNQALSKLKERLENFSAPGKDEVEERFKQQSDKAGKIDFSNLYVNPRKLHTKRKSIFYHISNINLY